MRYIDIYKQAGNDFVLVAQDCIQTESADLTRKAVLKSFSMADGSTVLYTSGNDSAEMTLSLECNQAQIQAISEALHVGELYFAGMRAGAHALPTPTENGYFPQYLENSVPAYIGILTENSSVKILETAAHADLFALQIPLKLETSGGQFRTELIDSCYMEGFSIAGTVQNFQNYRYHKGDFIRKSVIFTNRSQIIVGQWGRRAGCFYTLLDEDDNVITGSESWTYDDGYYTPPVNLNFGLNTLILQITSGELKPVRFQFSVYRQAVTA